MTLLAYPPAFRRAYGRDMAQVFRDRCRETYRSRGVGGLMSVWGAEWCDLAVTACRERGEEIPMRHGGVMNGLIAVLCCLCIGYLNTHTDEVAVVAPVVLVVAVALGAVARRRAWSWALLVGLAVPLSQVVALLVHLRVPYPNDASGIGASCVALVPAVIGAALGQGLRRLVTL